MTSMHTSSSDYKSYRIFYSTPFRSDLKHNTVCLPGWFSFIFCLLLADYDVTVRIRTELTSRAENVYWDVEEFDLHVDNLKLFEVNFENLFNEGKELGK